MMHPVRSWGTIADCADCEDCEDAELRSVRAAIAQQFARAHSAASCSPKAPSTAAELERLMTLRDRHAITDDEYVAAKREVLADSGSR